LISNKYGLEIFYTAFKEAADGEEFIGKQKFHYAIILLSKALYGNRPGNDETTNPFEEMFTNMLIDKTPNATPNGRIPKLDDEDNKEVLSEEAIIMYLAYMDQLKQLF
jgi:hypothetical protein